MHMGCWVLGIVLGGCPENLVCLEPIADGALHADVVASVPGADPLVFEDLVALFEEILPELALGDGLGDFGFGTPTVAVLVLRQGRDGELEEIEGLGREFDWVHGLRFVMCGDEQRAAFGDILLSEYRDPSASLKL